MIKYQGIGVCNAIAIGKVSLLQRQNREILPHRVDEIETEIERLERARGTALDQLEDIQKKAKSIVGDRDAELFEFYGMILNDDSYQDSIRTLIKEQHVNAEYAVCTASRQYASLLETLEDPYLQARSADIKDIADRLIACLSTSDPQTFAKPLPENTILCAEDLTPSETITLDKEHISAFVTAGGSVNSHTAILARSMNLPAVVAAGRDFLEHLQEGTRIIVDGFTGEILLDPDEETEKNMLKKQEAEQKKRALLQELKGKDNVTLDGTRIRVCANIDSPESLGAVRENDADGIGLFRSEFLYLGRPDYPSEEEQFRTYRSILETMGGKKAILRTLDIGADKQAPAFGLRHEENPALGLRAIRICLTRPELFKTQLRALYRASAFGNLGILFPMITSVSEVEGLLSICREVREELDNQGIAYSPKTELGIMIETPASAIISDLLAPLVDFFSIGTNDLTQYTLAIDRQNADLTPFCDPHHEAILRLIEMTARNAHHAGKWVGICGELAADTSLTEAFLRMGIDELSVAPSCVLPLRDRIRSIDLRIDPAY